MLLAISNLSVHKNKKIILKDISFTMNSGEILAVIGPNGAGKSTLLNSISGDMIFDCSNTDNNKSSIQFNATPISSWEPIERAKKIAYLKQTSTLNFAYTVEEVIKLGRIPHNTGIHIDKEIITHILSKLDITHLKNQFYTQLSGGEKQRVHLARVFTQLYNESDLTICDNKKNIKDTKHPQSETIENKPQRLLLLDEPTSGLDLKHKHALMEIIKSLTQKNIGVMMVIHDFSFAAQYADKVLALHKGKTIAFGNTENVMTKPILEKVFNKEVFILEHPKTKKPIIVG